ncbi:uncharacterized protein JCM10292_007637 [Rhodotorula paludigena]|uniref:uncharacterized protein n=1 Tax=Rhodotorula paludigena TaxID=86838 RepID=UPI00317C4E68
MPDAALFEQRQVDPLLSEDAFSAPPLLASRGPLHPGAIFAGVQRSGRNSYEVKITVDTVDVREGRINGTLEIKGLTPELDSLVTWFEGDIVGEVGGPGFRTGKYGATEVDDLKHWRRFPAFTRNRLEHQLVKPDLNLRNARNRPYLFMRLKERFVVNHRVEAIHGASYAGFYYACLDCEPGPGALEATSHRGISPAPRPSPPLGLRRNASSLLTQTRPPPTRAPSASPPRPTVNLPSPAAEPPAVTARPPAPRRSSSGASYAAALRGEAASPSTDVTMSPPSPPLASSSSPTSTSPFTPPTPHTPSPSTSMIDLPTPKAELDRPLAALEPSEPLPPLWQAIATHPLSPSLHGAATTSLDSEWPAPAPAASSSSPPRRPQAAMRRMSSDAATVLAKTKSSRGRGAAHARRKSVAEEVGGEDESDDRGLRSWTEATISGFYFHHSASPYQELSLRYVPAHRGGSANFSFR